MNINGPRVDARIAEELGIPETGFLLLQTETEYRALAAAAAAIPAKLRGMDVVEIGAGVGTSTAVLASALLRSDNPARVLAIDALLTGPKRMAAITGCELPEDPATEQLGAILTSTAGLENVKLEIADATTLIGQTGAIALLEIDGDHHEPAVLADLQWAQFVVPGGLMVLHDVGKRVTPDAGPTGAVLQWLAVSPDWRTLLQVGSLLILQRLS